MSACSKIRHIVRIRQMLRRWRKKAATSARQAPADVPAGHVAVAVGSGRRRFVIRAAYLNHPLFRKLLVRAEEEYGFGNPGPLALPCDESLFEEILRYVARTESDTNGTARFMSFEDFQRYCRVDFRSNLEFWAESRPLLQAPNAIYFVGHGLIYPSFNSVGDESLSQRLGDRVRSGDGKWVGESPQSRPGSELETSHGK
ncbi:SAUR-like auxin-responsive protein family [Striga asiatica]|uniref:SAUR-like auxin-responsive protein family n=1 Tax=Striga asiatica TaxID=4170 RepID=A0A5A7P1I4_STRAF|nr:SAUR-like auxin-responsive protein family [Striga asiatica]